MSVSLVPGLSCFNFCSLHKSRLQPSFLILCHYSGTVPEPHSMRANVSFEALGAAAVELADLRTFLSVTSMPWLLSAGCDREHPPFSMCQLQKCLCHS